MENHMENSRMVQSQVGPKTENIIRKKIKQKKLILVDQVRWIGLNLFKSFKKNIHAFIGAPAPGF